MEHESVVKLALRCADRQIASSDFLNLYKEFYNEKVNDKIGSDDTPKEYSEVSTVFDALASDFIHLLTSQQQLILADYTVEVLFVNYNASLVRSFLPQIHAIENTPMLIHFISQSSAFFSNLSDAIIVDEVCNDLPNCILPSILGVDVDSASNDLVIAICKLLQVLLNCSPNNITMSSDSSRDNLYALTSQLSKINKLLFKRISQVIDSKLTFKDSRTASTATKETMHELINSPSITSPQFIPSPFSTIKTPASKGQSSLKYRDMKLLRYYKNIWLNNKISNWETINADFMSKYSSIASSVFMGSTVLPQSFDSAITDLIETSFTCFAQFVSNKQYHQANSYFNLLERKWVTFITKHIPLLVLQHSSGNPEVVTSALENIDDKVVKAIRTYYSEKDDIKTRDEDLFDDYPSTSLDIRHDFIKNLVRLNLQPPNVITNYLREDQVIDIKALPITDDLIVRNSQGVQEVVADIEQFISSSLDSLDTELIGSPSNEHGEGLQQILSNFENISPTKQREISTCLVNMLDNASRELDFNRITKICSLLSFNFSHSLTSILSFATPGRICEILMRFVDVTWESSVESKRKEIGDSEYDTMSIFLSFSWSILLLIVISQTYDFSLVDVAVKSSELTTVNSFTILFTSKLPEIPDVFLLDPNDANNSSMQMSSDQMVENWVKDLFVNGSISDSLLQNVDAKQLSLLVPFIFKQVLLTLETASVDKFSSLIGGLEYFLQPFMLIGLIKIVYWLEQYLCSLKSDIVSDDLLEKIFVLLNSIFHPASLNEDSTSFHNAILRLNATKLLKVLRRFRTQSQSNYGIYSSESTGNPNLESLIKTFLTVLQISPNYNIDPRILSTENDYPQKQLGYGSFLVLNENPINKIMTNQINSFWNLHSSTYYNLDYLNEIIELVTPRHFLVDVLRTLEYKLSTYGVPGTRNKMAAVESESVLDYFFYFLVLRDARTSTDAIELKSLLKTNQATDSAFSNDSARVKSEISPKQEPAQDDDFDMLFGENDNSVYGGDDEIAPLQSGAESMSNNRAIIPIRNSFGLIIHEMKKSYDAALISGDVSKEKYDKICKYHEKYLFVLNTCNF